MADDPSTSWPPMSNARRPTVRRSLRLIAAGTIWAICIIATFVIWSTVTSWGAQKQLEKSEAWARQAMLRLRSVPGGEKLHVSVPLRMKLSGPDFFMSVGGGVLDEETSARLRVAFDAMGPPANVHVKWHPWNFYGDAKAYQEMEITPLEDEVSPPHSLAADPFGDWA